MASDYFSQSIYFRSRREIAMLKRAAKKQKKSLSEFMRDAAIQTAGRVNAASKPRRAAA
jgi:uncharacterized protein (DUF1778 family)